MRKIIKYLGLCGLLFAICFVASCSSKVNVSAIVEYVAQRISIKVDVTLIDPDEELVDGAVYLTIYKSSDEDQKVIETKSLSSTKTSVQSVKFDNLDTKTEYVITLYATYNKTRHVVETKKIATTESGSAENPIIINSFDDFVAMNNDEEAYYKLGKNIDAAGESLAPLFSSGKPFIGSFDGDGKTISNIAMGTKDSPVSDSYQGVFGYNKGTIKNVKFENVTIFASRGSDCYVGALCGYNVGPISDVTMKKVSITTISTSTGRHYIGGFIGRNADNGDLTNCSVSDLTITSSTRNVATIGGFIGENACPNQAEKNQTITNCSVDGKITVTQTNTSSSTETIECVVGGFVGTNLKVITDSYSDVELNVTVSKASTAAKTYLAHVGGFAGEMGISAVARISGCAATVNTTLTSKDLIVAKVGSLVGYIGSYGTLKNCVAITKDAVFDVKLPKECNYKANVLIGEIINESKNITNTVTGPEAFAITLIDTSTTPEATSDVNLAAATVCTDYTIFAEKVNAFITANK